MSATNPGGSRGVGGRIFGAIGRMLRRQGVNTATKGYSAENYHSQDRQTARILRQAAAKAAKAKP